MFGLLNPGRTDLPYRRAYSRLCQHQRRHYGLPSLAFLSYEATLLYLCAADAGAFSLDELPERTCCRLRRLPGRTGPGETEAARFCASLGLLLGWIKIADDLRDRPHFLARLAAWVLRRRFRDVFAYFERIAPGFERDVDALIAAHLALESRAEPASIEEYVQPTGRAFGHVFSLASTLPGMASQREFLQQLGDRVGSAIIAHDCAVDRDRDRRRGDYNPLPDGEQPIVDALALCRRHLRQAAALCRIQFGESSHAARILDLTANRIPHACRPSTCRRASEQSRGMLERWGLIGPRRGYQLNSFLDVIVGVAAFAGVCIGGLACMVMSSKNSNAEEEARIARAKAADQQTLDPNAPPVAAPPAAKTKSSNSCCLDGLDCCDIGCCSMEAMNCFPDCSNLDCGGADCSGCDCNCN